MTDTSPAPNRLSHWLRRLWPLYCFLAALVTFGYALYDSYQIDGDAVAYMDIWLSFHLRRMASTAAHLRSSPALAGPPLTLS